MTIRKSLAAAVVALSASAAPLAAQDFVNILTGGTSGVYYPMGVAISKLYSEAMPDARVQVQSTKASVENLNLLQQGRGELGFSLGDSVKAAAEGDEEAGFPAPLDKLRGLAAFYPNYIQIVASEESGITTLEDLKGKAVSVGAPKSGTELNARKIFEAAGMSYDDLGKVEYLPFAESVELMKNRQLDATLQSAGLGVASLKDLSTSIPITVVSVPSEVVDTLGAPYVAGEIPAGTYEGQDEAVGTVAIINYLVTSDAVSDDTAYLMTKSIFENLDDLRAAHSAAEAVDVQKALQGMTVPVHPGAQRYYDEVGVSAE
ncbi:TAXI family TRAP transporter solute-binding subunit [Paracoccus sp. SCSIO 75233]|uniref:TAXI family TRAP transporter solute-binding subunit n=1 Tax=Paracoccus sp. SCSIO 75233 TaxID=3017782 RepID=UPI0022F0A0F6|nr:TAXI family TRAP transporter solute-binding subunit [Paracoccus sp. SCSIO 75233]WBU54357.1 TAXI family TRAP transporter solute-binding subunit [Paracoccus sp. SCSIO 75233]